MAFLGLLAAAFGALLILSGWTNYSLSKLVQGKLVKRG